MPAGDDPQPPNPPKKAQPKPIDGSAYGASSSESGGNYDWAGATSANVEGEPADEEVDEALEEFSHEADRAPATGEEDAG